MKTASDILGVIALLAFFFAFKNWRNMDSATQGAEGAMSSALVGVILGAVGIGAAFIAICLRAAS